ncbi:hypothetical protein NDU88_003741 [Pleurodeles waltl]|uniref:Uncharacterized protein n=1 Tax=Pleurodeles waltl TaxID=8319 RepID=A0AAV7UH74_PLEWA|nr:hypothetical protein NDU88_003741 [Pleurodeles waltl]
MQTPYRAEAAEEVGRMLLRTPLRCRKCEEDREAEVKKANDAKITKGLFEKTLCVKEEKLRQAKQDYKMLIRQRKREKKLGCNDGGDKNTEY